MRGYYSSWDGALRAEYDTAVLEEETVLVILKKKTYGAITMSRWIKFSSCQKKTLHCKLLSVELLKDTEVQSVCKRGASDLLACFLPFLSITYIRTVALGLVSGDQRH